MIQLVPPALIALLGRKSFIKFAPDRAILFGGVDGE